MDIVFIEGEAEWHPQLPRYYSDNQYTFFETANELVTLFHNLVKKYKLNPITEKKRVVSLMMMLNPTTMVYFRTPHPPSYPRVARVVKYLLENGERPLRFLFPNKRMDEIFVCEAPLNYSSDLPYEARFEGYTQNG